MLLFIWRKPDNFPHMQEKCPHMLNTCLEPHMLNMYFLYVLHMLNTCVNIRLKFVKHKAAENINLQDWKYFHLQHSKHSTS